MQRVCAVVLVVMVTAQSGCLSPRIGGSSLPAAKKMADHLESFPLGTSLAEIKRAAPNLFPCEPGIVTAREYVDYWLGCNRSLDRTKGLYRMYPRDVLLTTARDDDQVARFPVRETLAYDCPDGAVEVLLSADGRFKGYYAYSSRGYSRDSRERLQAEREYFRRVLQPLVPEASARLASRGGGGDAWNRSLPHLPLKLLDPVP